MTKKIKGLRFGNTYSWGNANASELNPQSEVTKRVFKVFRRLCCYLYQRSHLPNNATRCQIIPPGNFDKPCRMATRGRARMRRGSDRLSCHIY